jgi:HlyD family secretion protein
MREIRVMVRPLLLVVLLVSAAQAQEKPSSVAVAQPAEKATEKPAEKAAGATTKVEQGTLVVETVLKGTVEADEAVELFLDMKSWAGPFTVKSALPHGTRVTKGQVVLELETQKIELALRDLRVDRELAEIAVRQLKAEIPVLEKLSPLNLAAAEREAKNAEEDLNRYTAVEREHNQKAVAFSLKSQEQWLEYAQEELKQLQQMYRDKDLTEETEEIILKRQRNQIEQIEFMIETQKLQKERATSIELPRQDIAMQDRVQKATIALEKAVATLPLEVTQKHMALKKAEAELTKLDERLKDLEADRSGLTFAAPIDGIVGHGQADRGQWNVAAVSNRLRPKGVLQATEIFMTIVSSKAVSLRADADEKDLHTLKEGLECQATPVGFPDLKLGGRLQSVSLVPRAAGSFETRIHLDSPQGETQLAPGMIVNAKFITYRNEEAVLAPSASVFRDVGSETSYVYKMSEGKPVKTEVKVGKSSSGKTEILSGAQPGDEILTARP